MTEQPERPTEMPEAEREDAQLRSERQRAAAYLDLWERNLVHLAVHGPPVLHVGGR
jgi:hypothetical protein